MESRNPLQANVSRLPKASGLPKLSGLPKPSGIARPAVNTHKPSVLEVSEAKPPVNQKRKLNASTENNPVKRTKLNTSTTSNAGNTSQQTTSLLKKSNSTSNISKVGMTMRAGARPAASTRGAVAQKAKPPASGGGGAGKRPAWDLKGRIADMENAMKQLKDHNVNLQGQVENTDETSATLAKEADSLRSQLLQARDDLNDKQEDLDRVHRQLRETEDKNREETRRLRNDLEDAQRSNSTLQRKNKDLEADVDVARQEATNLRMTINNLTAAQSSIKAELEATKISLEQSDRESRDKTTLILQLRDTVVELEKTIEDQKSEIRDHEMTRRKLHNTIQELKGNIRVFCRVRPLLGDERLGIEDEVPGHISFPDPQQNRAIELEKTGDVTLNESNISAVKKGTKYLFQFDKVFTPNDTQSDVFGEISQLVQSSLDGYNVCIFAYGQTGSGKTYTMEGYGDKLGMIPLAVQQVFQTASELQDQGWKYDFEASFLEIYNETIRDLLSKNDNQKHEIKMVPNSAGHEIFVSNLTSMKVSEQNQVHQLLKTAGDNRAVAETKCNSRSSRSHSVFRLRISGKNEITHDTCTATLNLIDLAGSERLKESGSEGDRLKETKAINKSLANLGNVIMALANKDPHIPYRNSKLTHLLQNSLGGNSKCLMFVNVAPKEECFNETLNTLRFATKVNNCNIGTAQRVNK